jgi:hypothetical protein
MHFILRLGLQSVPDMKPLFSAWDTSYQPLSHDRLFFF